jgi:hypothetical protein
VKVDFGLCRHRCLKTGPLARRSGPSIETEKVARSALHVVPVANGRYPVSIIRAVLYRHPFFVGPAAPRKAR